jgi:hypothetical protein
MSEEAIMKDLTNKLSTLINTTSEEATMKNVCKNCDTDVAESKEYCIQCAPHMKGHLSIKEQKELLMELHPEGMQFEWNEYAPFEVNMEDKKAFYARKKQLVKAIQPKREEQRKAQELKSKEDRKAYELFIKENESLLGDLTYDEREALGLDQDSEIERYKLVDDAIAAYYDDIISFREDLGEDVSTYWRGKNKKVQDVMTDKGEDESMSIPTVDCSSPVEKHGNLESHAKAFDAGITCGTSFTDTGRNYYFEIGMNPNQVHDATEDEFVTFDGQLALEKGKQSYAKQLQKEMQFVTDLRNETADKVEAGLPEVMAELNIQISELTGKYEVVKKQAIALVIPTVNAVVNELSEGHKVMPYPALKDTRFRTEPSKKVLATKPTFIKNLLDTGMTETQAEVEWLVHTTKKLNTIYLASVYSEVEGMVKAEHASELLGREVAFMEVQDTIKMHLESMTSAELIAKIKSKEIVFNAAEVQEAALVAKDWKAEERFSKREYWILTQSGLIVVPKTVKKSAKADYVINKEIAKLLKQVQEGDLDCVTPDNAQAIAELAAKGGKEYRIANKESYKHVRSMIAA